MCVGAGGPEAVFPHQGCFAIDYLAIVSHHLAPDTWIAWQIYTRAWMVARQARGLTSLRATFLQTTAIARVPAA